MNVEDIRELNGEIKQIYDYRAGTKKDYTETYWESISGVKKMIF